MNIRKQNRPAWFALWVSSRWERLLRFLNIYHAYVNFGDELIVPFPFRSRRFIESTSWAERRWAR